MRTITRVAIVALLALVAGACGGDDDVSSDEPTTTTTPGDGEATDDGAATDDGESDDGGTDGGVGAGLVDADCQFLLAGAFLNPLAAAVPGGDPNFDEGAEQLEAIADAAPDEIQDAMATLSEGYAAFAEILQDVDFSDPQGFADPDVQAALAELEEIADEEYQEAGEVVSTYVAENCGG